MANKMDDLLGKTAALLEEIGRVKQSYDVAVNAYRQLEGDEPVNLTGVGLSIHLGDLQLPLPLPVDREQLLQHLADSSTFCVNELGRLWAAVHAEASNAANYCVEVIRRAQEPNSGAGDTSVLPPSIAPFPGQQPPPMQPPRQPPQQIMPPAMPPARPAPSPSVTIQPGGVRTSPVS